LASKTIVKLLRTLLAAIVTVSAVLSAPTFASEGKRTPLPTVDIANPGKCIAPAEEMRRNHMVKLKHQRERTMREGIRGESASLNECVNCHASKKTGSVHQEGEFCQSCHAYAAVKLDCFQCHQPKANFKSVSAGTKP
jgi:hypothetical protein